nr:hypothetical protein [Burkholderiales bacterium]
MSKLLDSLRQAERARREKNDAAATQSTSETAKAAASVRLEAQQTGSGETDLEKVNTPGVVTLRIESAMSPSRAAAAIVADGTKLRKPLTERATVRVETDFSLGAPLPGRSQSRLRAAKAATETARKKAENDRKRKAREESRIETERALTAAALTRMRAERDALAAAQSRTRTEVESARVARERARAEADAEAMSRAVVQQEMQLKAAIDARVAAEREAEFAG